MMQRTEALRRLRAADPALGVEIPPLPAIRTTVAEDAPVVPDITAGVRPGSRQPRRAAAFLAAAAIVAGLSVGGVALTRGDGGTTKPSTTVAPPLPAVPASKAQVERMLGRLLARTPVLDGAVRQASSPVQALRRPDGTDSGSHALDTHAWWTAPTWKPKAAFAWYRHHTPDGMRISDWSGPGIGPLGPWPTKWTVSYYVPDTADWAMVELQIQIAHHGSGTAVRADASGVWLSPRPADSMIAAPRLVMIKVRWQVGEILADFLYGTPARRLADQLNKFTAVAPGELRHCPRSPESINTVASYTLVFHTPSGLVRAVGYPWGCHPTRIYRDGKLVVTLHGDVGRLLSKLLGLPSFSE